MRRLGLFATAFLVLCLAACSGKKEDKKDDGKTEAINEDNLLGTWELTKSGKGPPPPVTLEFTRDGKLIMTSKHTIPAKEKREEKEIRVPTKGTYKVEGNTVKTELKFELAEKAFTQTLKIKELSNTRLVMENEEGVLEEWRKK
jgi:uncharacterized protein (TIGR03066 family)